jgi:signal peptidase I
MEIKPTYVTFEQAKLLKEKGFEVKEVRGGYLVPEQWQVVEWLRVKHGIWTVVNWGTNNDEVVWYYGISKIGINSAFMEKPYYKTPQEAISAAFDYCLKELI